MNQQVRSYTSVGGTLAAIAFTNVVLLVGLFALGWPPGTIAFLFWFEAAVIGAVTFVKVSASSPGEVTGSGKNISYVRFAMVLIVGEHLWAFRRDYARGPAWRRADATS